MHDRGGVDNLRRRCDVVRDVLLVIRGSGHGGRRVHRRLLLVDAVGDSGVLMVGGGSRCLLVAAVAGCCVLLMRSR